MTDSDRQREARRLLAAGQGAIQRGDFEAAARDLEAARTLTPGALPVLQLLAGTRQALGDHAGGIALLEEATAQAPGEPGLWYGLCLLCHGAGRYRAALQACERALELAPGWADALSARGKLGQLMGDPQAAEVDFRAALARAPGHADALGGLAAGLELRGRHAEALALLDPVIDGRVPPSLVITWCRLQRRGGEHAAARAKLAELLAGPLPAVERSHALFALGDVLEACGTTDEAFTAYTEANALKPGEFDPTRWTREVDSIVAAWNQAALAGLPSAEASARPLFIVGMPRSGTTLVEQILAAHPSVFAGGELTALDGIARDVGVGVLPDPGSLPELAQRYLARAGGPTDAARVTDKMPSNFRHLGLVRAIFPAARIVHCRRDPYDVALSCFRQDFSALGLAWTRRLETIGAYHAGYRRLMDHWAALLGDSILHLDYEGLVAEPEAGARRLVDFAGLEWHPDCLRSHQLGGDAATASHDQVRRPIYTDAVGRHRPYAPHLAPLRAWFGHGGVPPAGATSAGNEGDSNG